MDNMRALFQARNLNMPHRGLNALKAKFTEEQLNQRDSRMRPSNSQMPILEKISDEESTVASEGNQDDDYGSETESEKEK